MVSKRQARAKPDVQRRGNPVLPEHQVPVQFAAAPGHGHDAKPATPGRAGLASTGFQYDQPAAENAASGDRGSTNDDGLASAGGQQRHQDVGRRRMEDEKHGARCTSESTRPRSKSVPWRWPITASAMHLSCRDCSTRLLPMSVLPASAATARTTQRTAMRPLPCAKRMPSSRPARTPNPGRPSAAARTPAMTFCTGHAGGAGDLEKMERLPSPQSCRTKMRCFKLLGERVMARDFDRQVAELQVRAAVLNRFTRLGTRLRSQCYKTDHRQRQLASA